MRAFYHPDQAAHDPQQYMRFGRVVAPKDVPARTDALLAALSQLNIAPEAPSREYGSARAAVHAKAFLDFLETAWDRWQLLPDKGPEVWPNTFPYWSGRPEEAARADCRPENLIAHAGWYLGDLSVPIGANTWISVRESCNTAIAAADAVINGERLVYALCRPSGHHARADRASGFCYVNNTAAAAQWLRSRFSRVAILDVDAHHGDGTQQIFYLRPDVLTISIHADPTNYHPFYTGYEDELGAGDGRGCNFNLPLAHGAKAAAMYAAVDRAAERIRGFGAEVLVIALGFDAHARDPIGVLKLESEDFGGIGARVKSLGLPTVIVQEGGYAVDALTDCLRSFLGSAMTENA
jgi:acetoin utilization deacetylase AcuC-like enzyme